MIGFSMLFVLFIPIALVAWVIYATFFKNTDEDRDRKAKQKVIQDAIDLQKKVNAKKDAEMAAAMFEQDKRYGGVSTVATIATANQVEKTTDEKIAEEMLRKQREQSVSNTKRYNPQPRVNSALKGAAIGAAAGYVAAKVTEPKRKRDDDSSSSWSSSSYGGSSYSGSSYPSDSGSSYGGSSDSGSSFSGGGGESGGGGSSSDF